MISPHLTVEEAYLLCKLMRGIDAEAFWCLGPVPTVGENERFPSGFTIRRGKMSEPPRRRGDDRPFRPSRDDVRRIAAGIGSWRSAGRLGVRRIQEGLDRPGDGRGGSSG